VKRTVTVMVVAIALVGALSPAPAFAQTPQPEPPPNPTGEQLEASSGAVDTVVGQVAQLSAQLTSVQARVDDLQQQLAARREDANRALVDLQAAQRAADDARARADRAGIGTMAASSAVDTARLRLDNIAVAVYQGALDVGPLGLLSAASSPDDLVARAQFTDSVAVEQAAALTGLQRAVVIQANAESTARLARDQAVARQGDAAAASRTADTAVATAERAAVEQARQLETLDGERQAVQRRLDDLRSRDAGLRAQRDRFDAWERRQARDQAARDRAEQRAAAARVTGDAMAGVAGSPAPGSATVQRVIDRALAQLGVRYSWGGGNAGGPTVGVRDGGVADTFGDYRRIGFDCSGLLIYAFASAGITLPHYSGYQYAQGRKVPLAQMRPGDLIAYQTGGRIGHIAMYIGGGRMVEAPYSGSQVRIAPVRFTRGLLPDVARLL